MEVKSGVHWPGALLLVAKMKEPNRIGCNRHNLGGQVGCYPVEEDGDWSEKVVVGGGCDQPWWWSVVPFTA